MARKRARRRGRRGSFCFREAHRVLSLTLFIFSALFFLYVYRFPTRSVHAITSTATSPSTATFRKPSISDLGLSSRPRRAWHIFSGNSYQPSEPSHSTSNSRSNEVLAEVRAALHSLPNGLEEKLAPAKRPYPWEPHVGRGLSKASTNADIGNDASIFRARRRGAWMGCGRAHFVVCVGVYRSLKRGSCSTLTTISCAKDADWLGHVLRKLRGEFRPVHKVDCIVKDVFEAKLAHAKLAGVRGVHVRIGNERDIQERAECVLRLGAVEGNLVNAMRIFKALKRRSVVNFIHDTYPSGANSHVHKRSANNNTLLYIDVAIAPFTFPPPTYTYENEADNYSGRRVQVNLRRVSEMLEDRDTPSLQEMMDPRKRRVLE